MQGPDLSLTLEFETLVQRIGRPPEAPLMMPKQRLEDRGSSPLARLIGARVAARDVLRASEANGTK